MTRCGMVAIVGEPNAGKSTLINRLVGGKVSIVTPKAQTTRFNVRGVTAEGDAQLIFIDTPGIFSADKQFEKAMVQAAWSGIGEADAVLVVIDAKRGLRDSTLELLDHLKPHAKKPFALAINKIDAVDKKILIALAEQLRVYDFIEFFFMISAKSGDGVLDIKKWLAAKMPEGVWLYPEDQMSDIPMRLLAAEVTREKTFLLLKQELPYAVFVETEHWEEGDRLVKISQLIYVEREGQKKIIIGEKGAMLKRIGSSARRELEKMLEKKIHLTLFVKVNPRWRDTPENYRLLGLEFRK